MNLHWLKDLGGLNLGREKLFRVILMLTDRCMLRCRTCGIWRKETTVEPAFSELETFFFTNKLSWLNLTGGEIFLRKDLPEIFRLIGSTQPHLAYISFPTSGYLPEATLAGAEAALESGLSKIVITVSFDGGRASHDALRGREGAFDRARETFLALGKLDGLKVIPGMTLSSALLELSDDPVQDLVTDLGLQSAREIHVNLAHASSHYYGNQGLDPLPAKKTIDLIERLGRSRAGRVGTMDLLESLYLKGARHYLESGEPPLRCKALRASVFIDADWTVYPCTIYARPLGHLSDQGFNLDRMAETPGFKEARAAIDRGDCPGCWTPCEAYTAISGSVLAPSFFRLAFRPGSS